MKKVKKISAQLMWAFILPTILIVLLGAGCYVKASDVIMRQYRNSAENTMKTMDLYLSMMCDNIKSKMTEMLMNKDLQNYYGKYYEHNTADGVQAYNDLSLNMGAAQITLDYMGDYFIFAEKGKCVISTSQSKLLDADTYERFMQAADGALFQNEKIVNGWIGAHPTIDEQIEYTQNQYAFSYVTRFADKSGVIVADISKDFIHQVLTTMEFGENSIKGIVTADGREILVKEIRENGESVSETMSIDETAFSEFVVKDGERSGSSFVQYNGAPHLFIYSQIGETGMQICALIPEKHIISEITNIRQMTIVFVLLAVIIALTMGKWIAGGIGREIQKTKRFLEKMSEGDLTKEMITKRKDEFLILAQAINNTNITVRDLVEKVSEFEEEITDSANRVNETTATVAETMDGITETMSKVSDGAMEQAKDTEKCMEQMTDFSELIQHISEKTTHMNENVDAVRESLQDGRSRIGELNEKSNDTISVTRELITNINKVQEQSESISGIVDTINEIANQTELLSLNASIEAARAGMQGRGFAVVAEEIRKLADESMMAGNKIKAIVDKTGEITLEAADSARKAEGIVNVQKNSLEQTNLIFERMEECVRELINGLQLTLSGMDSMMEKRNGMVEAITNISAFSEEVAASTQSVAENIQEQDIVIGQLAQRAEALQENAKELNKMMKFFRIK